MNVIGRLVSVPKKAIGDVIVRQYVSAKDDPADTARVATASGDLWIVMAGSGSRLIPHPKYLRSSH